MDKNQFFQTVINFIDTVYSSTHSLTKDTRPTKLTPQQYSILEYIFFSKAVTTSQVADCLNISLPNASRELKKLFKLKLIVKESIEKDRRKTTISLSESGQNLMLHTFERVQKNFWKQTGELPEDEMKSIVSSMDILDKKAGYILHREAIQSDIGKKKETAKKIV